MKWLSISAFVYLTATAAVMASERVYWPWGGISVDNILGISAYYALPMAATLWLLARVRASRFSQVVLAGAVFGFLVEGVLTSVIYEDGPLPVLALLFVGWHGVVAFVGFWYLARRWLVGRRRGFLVLGSLGIGLYWGLWAQTWRLPEAADGLDVTGLAPTPSEFALYAIAVGGTLTVAHWLLGFVWPRRLVAHRWVGLTIGVLLVGYHVVAAVVVVPWAPLKLAALLALPVWLLWRRRAIDGPDLFGQLAGRVRLTDAALLLVMPLVASGVFWAGWLLGEDAIRGIFEVLNLVQVVAGTTALGWAAWREVRDRVPATVRPT